MKKENHTIGENVLNDLSVRSPLLLQNRIAWHVLFWSCFFIYEGLIWGMVDGEYSRRLITSMIELPVKISATYFTIYVLIDKYLIRKKYVLFVLSMLISMLAFGLVLRVVAFYTVYPMFYPEARNIPLFFPPKVLIAIFAIYSIVAIVASFHLIKLWYKHQQATQQLQQKAQQLNNEKLEAELTLLKSQINPHFLFNTLNNLYVLTLNNSQKAPEMIYKLSDLMSYMLYESNQKEVPLEKEVRYIENYISLEKIRYDERLDISLNVYNNVKGIKVAPLLILPFVENSFKHGVGSQIQKGWIRVDVSVKDGVLIIKVENSKSIPESEKSERQPSGIGLQNVKKRLHRIYPYRHNLQIFDEEETFLVTLRISLEPGALKNREFSKDTEPVTI